MTFDIRNIKQNIFEEIKNFIILNRLKSPGLKTLQSFLIWDIYDFKSAERFNGYYKKSVTFGRGCNWRFKMSVFRQIFEKHSMDRGPIQIFVACIAS